MALLKLTSIYLEVISGTVMSFGHKPDSFFSSETLRGGHRNEHVPTLCWVNSLIPLHTVLLAADFVDRTDGVLQELQL